MELSAMLLHMKCIGYILLITLTCKSNALTGLCETKEGHATCFACSTFSYPLNELAPAPRDCCGDPYVFSLCQRCYLFPEDCESIESFAAPQSSNVAFLRNTRGGGSPRNELTELTRRAKYFLGKRSGGSGSYDNQLDPDLYKILPESEKKPNAFLGKRASPFLGKRISYMKKLENGGIDDTRNGVNSVGDNYDNSMLMEDKRQKYFLGKRAGDIAEVGYAATSESEEEKRGLPLGGGAPPQPDPYEGESGVYTLLEDNANKRPSPFLGKRGGGKYFLGKRTDTNQANIAKLKDFYMRPLARRAKYFLGKRSEGENSLLQSKRQKYFLGKKRSTEAEGPLMLSDDYVNMHDKSLTEEVNAVKRQKYFLGKRDVSEVSASKTQHREDSPLVASSKA